MSSLTRPYYWTKVAIELGEKGLTTRRGAQLDWETIEAIAEKSGMLRINVPNPLSMAHFLDEKFKRPPLFRSSL